MENKCRKKLKVKVTIDRPLGYVDGYGNIYPINYGFIAGIIGGDGEEQDAYIISIENEKMDTFTGEVIAIITRDDDVEEKWIVAEPGTILSEKEIYDKVKFMEKYFDSRIILLDS
jgi:inorganic pyrophosphatase